MAALAALASGGVQADPAPDYSGARISAELRFLDAPADGMPVERSPKLHMSFGGANVRAIMDTGSTGILVSASAIPGVDALPSKGPGELTYTSSGRIMRGKWVTTPVTISGRDGASVTTKPMPVLAVTRMDCLDNARDCTPMDAPRHVAMMGVGFAREGDRQRTGTPDKNPFLNLDAGNGLRRGYVISRASVRLGLTAATTHGFSFLKLERNAELGDWRPLPACITAGDLPEACGTALVDTGVTAMFLTLPAVPAAPDDGADGDGGIQGGDQQEGQEGTIRMRQPRLAVGARLSVRFGGKEGPGYSFVVGDPDQLTAPTRIIPVGGRNRPTFVNTGVRLLNGFDYLYDADGGYVGFRRAGL